VGTHKPGDGDDPPRFYQPGGVSAGGNKLYVADTNNHKIKVIDIKSRAVKTLALADLTPPRLARRRPAFPGATTINVPAAEAAPGKSIELAVSLALPKGYKLNAESPMTYLLETPDKEGILSNELSPSGEKVSPPKTEFKITVPLSKKVEAGERIDLRLSLLSLICSEPSSLCRPRSLIWNVPITISDRAPADPIRLTGESK
jgi:hypothetical protein